MEKTTHLKFSILAILFIVGLAVSPAITHAATLYFSPSSGSHAVGTTLSVSIYVSSADQATNAASGVISFPRDKLEVTSLSKTSSIFSLWVKEPSFSNSAGVVNFEGIVLNPGFIGSNGKAITITFRTKAAGNAPLTFSSGSVLANDGKGTNILTWVGDANFAIGVGPGAPEIITPSEVDGAPEAPEISLPTHSDPNKFYAVVVPLVALVFLLFIIWYGWHKFALFRKKLKNLKKEVRSAESALHKAFDMLKEDIRDQVKLLEKTRTKRQLTEEEEKIIKQFKKDLDDTEKFVKKDIEDIEKELK